MSKNALTKAEARDLARLEDKIRAGFDTFMEVGGALAEIAERRLHRHTHETFADYCRDVWDIGPSRGYELIAAAKLVSQMSAKAETALLPKNEAQAAELLPVPAEKRAEVMQEAAKIAAPKPPSARDIATAAKPYVPMAERLERAEKRAEAKARKEAAKRYERPEEMADALTKKPTPPSGVAQAPEEVTGEQERSEETPEPPQESMRGSTDDGQPLTEARLDESGEDKDSPGVAGSDSNSAIAESPVPELGTALSGEGGAAPVEVIVPKIVRALFRGIAGYGPVGQLPSPTSADLLAIEDDEASEMLLLSMWLKNAHTRRKNLLNQPETAGVAA